MDRELRAIELEREGERMVILVNADLPISLGMRATDDSGARWEVGALSLDIFGL